MGASTFLGLDQAGFSFARTERSASGLWKEAGVIGEGHPDYLQVAWGGRLSRGEGTFQVPVRLGPAGQAGWL